MRFLRFLIILAATGPVGLGVACAEDASTLELGRRLIVENQCAGACHQSRAANGDATSLFTRANRKVNDFVALRKQVGRCLAAVNPSAPPADADAIAAALAHDCYKFPQDK